VPEPAGPNLADLAGGVAATARPGEQLEVYVARADETDIRVYDGAVESLSVARTAGVGVRVISAHRQGFAWCGTLDAAAVRDAVADARDNAPFGAPDEWNRLPEPSDLDGAAPSEIDGWRDDVLATSTDAKVALALEVERAARGRARIRGVELAAYGDTAVEVALATSTGIEASMRRTVCSCATSALAGDDGETQTGYGVFAGRSVAELDPVAAAEEATTRAARLLGARPTRSRALPVVLDPLVTRSLLSLIGGALGGEAVLKGRSVFAGREGEVMGAAGVTLVDDPTRTEAFGAASHDSEGVPTRRTTLIDEGRIAAFLHNTHTGNRAGTASTGSAVRAGYRSTPGVGFRALHLVPGPDPPEALLAAEPELLYVQTVSGLHSGTNPVSGDLSVGAEGLMVRGGAFAEPVREVTIASTLPRLLRDVTAVASDERWLPGGAAGVSVLVREMTISGT